MTAFAIIRTVHQECDTVSGEPQLLKKTCRLATQLATRGSVVVWAWRREECHVCTDGFTMLNCYPGCWSTRLATTNKQHDAGRYEHRCRDLYQQRHLSTCVRQSLPSRTQQTSPTSEGGTQESDLIRDGIVRDQTKRLCKASRESGQTRLYCRDWQINRRARHKTRNSAAKALLQLSKR
jgi:hypothetical protein